MTANPDSKQAIPKSDLTRQMIQNLVVFAGILFAHQWLEPDAIFRAVSAYIILSLMSYWVIRMADVILSVKGDWRFIFMSLYGRIPPVMKWIFWGTLLVSAVFSPVFALIILLFVGVALIHDLFLSAQVVLDVIVLAVEFTLRAVSGVVILKNVPVSPWLIACTFLLSMVVSLGKRRNEVLHREADVVTRAEKAGYSLKLLDQMLAVVTSSTFITYILYTISHRTRDVLGTTNLIYSIPFVLYGILRYLYLVNKKDMHEGSEIVILKDVPMILNIVLWMISVIVILNLS